MRIRTACVVLALILSHFPIAPARACMWDYDTIRDEKRGMPGIAEVLAGRFEKHSEFFNQQRVSRLTAVVKADPKNVDAWDTLACAYERLGDHDTAIETILAKDKIAPGLYTTFANLGTFYLHKGDFDHGIPALEKALEINPEAHFGREEYQLKLAVYFRDAKSNPDLLTSMNFLEYAGVLKRFAENDTYATTIPSTRPTTEPADEFELAELVHDRGRGWPSRLSEMGVKDNVFDGIVGMIRFGPGNSAELYLTLGDLLAMRGDKLLAYRAYQIAKELHHPREAYLDAVSNMLRGRIYYKDQASDETITRERDDASQWVKAYQAFEDDLVRKGVDTEEPKNYEAFYAEFGSPIVAPTLSERANDWRRHNTVAVICAVAFSVPILIYLVLRIIRQKIYGPSRRKAQ